MKKTNSHAFVNQLVVYTLCMICLSGSVGLGTVWMRHQISVTANNIKQIENKIEDCQRRLSETVTSIETEQSPDMLRHANSAMRLGLVPANEMQVHRVSDDVEMLLAAKRNQGLLNDGPVLVVFRPGGAH